ncbi:MAG: glutathione S-transferase N-terminal domain-containing protein, partial [Pseudomonadales bacterium]
MALVLHHYEGSLFSEKIRLMLGYYGLSWESVEISPIMPRPALMPLTGGYRRTPVLQDGADIFCDTHAISEYLDVLCPEKALAPRALAHAS